MKVTTGTFKADDLTRKLISEVLDSGYIGYGEKSREFEQRFASLHNSRYATLSNSGTSALHIALQTLKEIHRWDSGDEVIVPATTFVATPNIVKHNRMIPTFVDIEYDTYGIDPSLIEAAITDRTRAIIPVHLFGQPCKMDEILEIAKAHNLKVIEDSCFTGNTLIPTKDGTKRIKDVKVGDRLLGFNGKSFQETKVVNTMNRLVPFENILVIKFDTGLTVRCTKNHPFYVAGEWVEAENLKVNDEVWKSNWSEYTSWRREYKLTDEGKKTLSDNMKKNNPSFNPEIIKKSATNRLHKPSNLEKRVMQVAHDYNLPLKYVGDGNLWIGSKEDGYKNPDFAVLGEEKIIEVYDTTFKYEYKGQYKRRDKNWEEEKANFFAKFGYETKFLALSGFVGSKERERIAGELSEFIYNGSKIISIKEATKGFVKIYNSGKDEPEGMIRVYNLHCEPHNNFVLTSGILVHNCEAMFVTHNGKSVGSMGDIGCFSMYVAHLITAGVGGISTTSNPEYAEKMRSLVNHGLRIQDLNLDENMSPQPMINREFKFDSTGHSYRITEFEAAIALAQLETHKRMLKKRRRNGKHYIASLELINKSYGSGDWSGGFYKLPYKLAENEHSYMMMPLVLNPSYGITKDFIKPFLNERDIETRDMLPILEQPAYSYLNPADYRVSDMVREFGFYVGCHQDLTVEHVSYVCEALGSFAFEATNK